MNFNSQGILETWQKAGQAQRGRLAGEAQGWRGSGQGQGRLKLFLPSHIQLLIPADLPGLHAAPLSSLHPPCPSLSEGPGGAVHPLSRVAWDSLGEGGELGLKTKYFQLTRPPTQEEKKDNSLLLTKKIRQYDAQCCRSTETQRAESSHPRHSSEDAAHSVHVLRTISTESWVAPISTQCIPALSGHGGLGSYLCFLTAFSFLPR